MKKVGEIASLLILLGAINWGLLGLFNFNLIDAIFGLTWVAPFLYILIGLSAVYKIVNWQLGKKG